MSVKKKLILSDQGPVVGPHLSLSASLLQIKTHQEDKNLRYEFWNTAQFTSPREPNWMRIQFELHFHSNNSSEEGL